jgi:hypothetical protein
VTTPPNPVDKNGKLYRNLSITTRTIGTRSELNFRVSEKVYENYIGDYPYLMYTLLLQLYLGYKWRYRIYMCVFVCNCWWLKSKICFRLWTMNNGQGQRIVKMCHLIATSRCCELVPWTKEMMRCWRRKLTDIQGDKCPKLCWIANRSEIFIHADMTKIYFMVFGCRLLFPSFVHSLSKLWLKDDNSLPDLYICIWIFRPFLEHQLWLFSFFSRLWRKKKSKNIKIFLLRFYRKEKKSFFYRFCLWYIKFYIHFFPLILVAKRQKRRAKGEREKHQKTKKNKHGCTCEAHVTVDRKYSGHNKVNLKKKSK